MIFQGGATFHHFALALRSDGEALGFLAGLGYSIPEKIYDPEQNVHIRLCTAPGQPAIEIVTPGEGATPLDPILKRQAESFYHSCYEVDSIAGFVEGLEAAAVRVMPLVPAKPAVLFDGRRVAFYQVLGYGVIELLERSEKSL